MAGLVDFEQFKKVVRHQQAAKRAFQANPGRAGEAYRYIVKYKTQHDGNSPSMRQICDAIGIASTNTVSGYLDKLVDAGMIRKQRGNISVVGGKWTPPSEAL